MGSIKSLDANELRMRLKLQKTYRLRPGSLKET